MRISSFGMLFAAAFLAIGCGSAPSANLTETDESNPQTAAVPESAPQQAQPAAPQTQPVVDSTPAATFVENGIAIRGADPVAYFTEATYTPGSNEFTHEWNGAIWQFSSAENRDQFAADPEKFAPAYGGFCAWAVSQGYTAPVDPTAWKIVDGKLYLNFSPKIQARWEKDIPGNIAKADENWPGVLSN